MRVAIMSPLALAHSGRVQARIVVPTPATPQEEYAAEELRRHLLAMLGAEMSVRYHYPTDAPTVFINDRVAAEAAGIDVAGLALGPEAFHLETRDGNLYVLGGGARGVLYGVYDLLEMLGCRWFAPDVTRIPRVERVELPPLCKTEGPAFEFRDHFNWCVRDPIWWVRNRMNGGYTPTPDYLGGHIAYGLFVHTLEQLLPPEEFFAAHPEYFSLVQGQRRYQMAQPCLTHPHVLRIVTERVLAEMRAKPQDTIFSVSQNDWRNPCECPDCAAIVAREGSQAGPILHFVNQVAEATSKVFPEKIIDTLAYDYTLEAPRHVIPHPNVRVRMCPIRCCQAHGFGACDHPESLRNLRALEDWSHVTNLLYIWHYCTNFHHLLLPMPDLDELHANINLYHRHGVHGVFIQGEGADDKWFESGTLRGYVISKLLWNPAQPVWPLVDEFLDGFYGNAAPYVRQYLDIFHDRVRHDLTCHPSCFDYPTIALYQGDILERADAPLAAGEKLVHGAERHRLQMLRNGLTYARLFRNGCRYHRDGDVYRNEATPADVRAFDRMVRSMRAAGQPHFEERWPDGASEVKLRNRLQAHRIACLRDGEQSVAVVPTLGGHLLEWQAFGRQWLAAPDASLPWQVHPLQDGYEEVASLDIFTPLGWSEPYRASQSAEGLSMTVALALGLRMTRVYHWQDGVLRIDSTLENGDTVERPLGWWGGFHWQLPADAQLRFRSASGEQVIPWAELADGWYPDMLLEGTRLPQGEIRVEMPEYVITQRFQGEAIIRAIVGKVAADHVLCLSLRTEIAPLQPGERIHVAQEVRIARR
jgi:hypothetical protein